MSHTSIRGGEHLNIEILFCLFNCYVFVVFYEPKKKTESVKGVRKNDFLTALLICRVQRQCSKVGSSLCRCCCLAGRLFNQLPDDDVDNKSSKEHF